MKTPKPLPVLISALALAFSLAGSSLSAQTVAYDFADKPGSVAASTASIVASGYSSAISLVGYTDKTGAADSHVRWQTHPVALTTSRYLQVSITNPEAFTLTNFTFTPKGFRAAESSQIEVRFSTKSGADFNTDYVTIWSSVTRYTAGDTAVSIALTDPAVLSMVQGITEGYFRIYTFDPWKASTETQDQGVWLGVDDIKITTASTIPEPSTAAALLGVAAIAGAVGLRRSRGSR